MIYDCFTFFNELDLLEIRLNVLDKVVDYFVVVEMDCTHTGSKKPFIFKENRERFERFMEKIIYVPVSAFSGVKLHDLEGMDTLGNDWTLENWQRAQIDRALQNCRDEDIILVSDLDEIPSPKAVKRNVYVARSGKIVAFSLRNYNFYLDFLSTERAYACSKMMSYACYKKKLPNMEMPAHEKFRYLPSYWISSNPNKVRAIEPDVIVMNAGWHFSYLGGVQKVVQKRLAIVEQQFNKGSWDDAEHLSKRIYDGRDMYGRGYLMRPLLTYIGLPRYVRENRTRYDFLFYNAPTMHRLRLNVRVVVYRIGFVVAKLLRKIIGRKLVTKVRRIVTR